MYRHDVTQAQFDALLAHLGAQGFDAQGSTLATLPLLLDRLHAERGYPVASNALYQSQIPLCEFCVRDTRATPAVVYAEVNTGSRSIGMYMNVCDACVQRVYALPPPNLDE